jgi:hypothetical protein
VALTADNSVLGTPQYMAPECLLAPDTGDARTDIYALGAVAYFLLAGIAVPAALRGARWIGHLPRGRFIHESISKSTPVRHEALLGWCAHYGIGVGFATLLLATFGLSWARSPTLYPALASGLVTVVALLFIPADGAWSRYRLVEDTAAHRVRSRVVSRGVAHVGGLVRLSRRIGSGAALAKPFRFTFSEALFLRLLARLQNATRQHALSRESRLIPTKSERWG